MSALHFYEGLTGKAKSLEAPRRYVREVRTRLVNDRIVSDKTIWNATLSNKFLEISKLCPTNGTALLNRLKNLAWLGCR
jgi:hypothetical protein